MSTSDRCCFADLFALFRYGLGIGNVVIVEVCYTQYPLQEIQLQEPVLEFGKKLETTSTEILRLRDIQITGKLDPSKNDYSVSLPYYLAKL